MAMIPPSRHAPRSVPAFVHIGMVNTAIRVTRTRPFSKLEILPYPGFPICRVLHHPPLGLPCMPWSPLIRLDPGFEESVPFDSLGNPVLSVFLQLQLKFFNQHIRRGFYPLSRLPQHVLLPHVNLRVVGLDNPIAQFIGNDHVLALGRLGLIRAHQHLLVQARPCRWGTGLC
jgi:hypothetical protein